MKYWIFKCDPERYLIDDRLNDPNPNFRWRVTRYGDEIAPGDIAFIWRTGKDRGIRAVINIISEPKQIEDYDHERIYCKNLDTGVRLRVEGKLMKHTDLISADMLRNIPELHNLSVFHGYQQATNFGVTDIEGKIIMELINSTT